MKKATADFLIEMLEDDEPGIIDSYSGRGCHGEETVAVKLESDPFKAMAGVVSSIFATPHFDPDDYPGVDYKDFESMRSDQLGKGYVIY